MNAPRKAPTIRSTVADWTPGRGLAFPPGQTRVDVPQAPALTPDAAASAAAPPQLVAIDSATFDTSKGAYAVFLNLPARGQGDPLATSSARPATPLVVDAGATAFFDVSTLTAAGPVSLQLQATTTDNRVVVGPTLGPGRYLTFRAKLLSPTSGHGTLVGRLYIIRGTS